MKRAFYLNILIFSLYFSCGSAPDCGKSKELGNDLLNKYFETKSEKDLKASKKYFTNALGCDSTKNFVYNNLLIIASIQKDYAEANRIIDSMLVLSHHKPSIVVLKCQYQNTKDQACLIDAGKTLLEFVSDSTIEEIKRVKEVDSFMGSLIEMNEVNFAKDLKTKIALILPNAKFSVDIPNN